MTQHAFCPILEQRAVGVGPGGWVKMIQFSSAAVIKIDWVRLDSVAPQCAFCPVLVGRVIVAGPEGWDKTTQFNSVELGAPIVQDQCSSQLLIIDSQANISHYLT